jgi:hypothetical protein
LKDRKEERKEGGEAEAAAGYLFKEESGKGGKQERFFDSAQNGIGRND